MPIWRKRNIGTSRSVEAAVLNAGFSFFFFGVYVQGTGKHCEEQVERQTGAADAILPGMI